MEILKSLASDHRELEKLFRQLDMTTERGVKTREKLFSKLKNLLDSHSKSEETVLYDRLKEESHEVRESTLEAFEEHHVAKILLKELTALDKDDERWGAKLSVLKEALDHHIEEEESTIFSKARKCFTRQELAEMGEEFESLKSAHLAGVGLPIRFAAKAVRKIAG
jgi:hemerythrin superfamily protein